MTGGSGRHVTRNLKRAQRQGPSRFLPPRCKVDCEVVDQKAASVAIWNIELWFLNVWLSAAHDLQV
jgi:hypothetical protein